MNKKYLGWGKDFFLMTFACMLMGFSINYFYISNHLAEGGVAGISLITHYLTGISVSRIYLIINIPLLILGWRFLGKEFIVKTIYGTFLLSFAIDFFSHYRTPIPDLLLSSLFGGVLVGLSLGLVFISGGSTGGTDIIAKIITRYRGLPVGKALMFMDFFILSSVAFLFGKLIFMYTLIASIVASKTVDLIQEGLDEAKGILIITSKPEALYTVISDELGRGVTFLNGEGAFTGKPLKVLYCVISKYQLIHFKKIVRTTDPEAFISIIAVHEVLGNGFKRLTMKD